jgi:putative acetyltransferase
MRSALEVRPERANDVEAIGDLIRSAFRGMPYADGDEAELIDALRAQGALSVSLVAELAGKIVGQVAFSAARAPGGTPGWFALGPVAVLPAHQRAGIGSTLIRTGLEAISTLGASGCILTGDPAYYSRFGFRVSPTSAPPGEPSEFFMVKLLCGRLPVGSIHFHEAFGGAATLQLSTASGGPATVVALGPYFGRLSRLLGRGRS